ncbi:MAG: F0F1 ATP synthase subunit alpha, partial [candidate division NC10 bacterium]|nr:F0F1 ATP synthase subunit alpha [candidate division NC10 bacterium]
RMVEILKQDQFHPLPVEDQILIIYAGIHGYLDTLPLHELKSFEEMLYRFVEDHYPTLKRTLRDQQEIDSALRAQIDRALKECLASFTAQRDTAQGSPAQ